MATSDIDALAQKVKRQVERELGHELHGCVQHYRGGAQRVWTDQVVNGVLVHGVPARHCNGCGSSHQLIDIELVAAIEELAKALAEQGIEELDLINPPGGRGN